MKTILLILLTAQFSFNLSAGAVQVLNPEVSFQAVHRMGAHIVASGTNGGIYQSTNNGKSWSKVMGPDNTQALQFRDIQLLSNGEVTVMSAGEGNDSRIYRKDLQNNWQLQSVGIKASTFYDCMHFINPQQGWLYGDSDDQGLFVMLTNNSGIHWVRQQLSIKVQAGEGGFASSGTCLNKGRDNNIYIGTGNTQVPRILIKNANEWQSLATPFAGGEAAGVFSVQQVDQWLYAFGGSLKTPNTPANVQQYNLTSKQWSALPESPLKGAVYGSAIIKHGDQTKVLIANPEGVAVWHEGEKNWTQLSDNNIWSLACDDSLGCVGVGKDGVVESFTFRYAH